MFLVLYYGNSTCRNINILNLQNEKENVPQDNDGLMTFDAGFNFAAGAYYQR
jgi:hypothetical protein